MIFCDILHNKLVLTVSQGVVVVAIQTVTPHRSGPFTSLKAFLLTTATRSKSTRVLIIVVGKVFSLAQTWIFLRAEPTVTRFLSKTFALT